MRSLPSSSLSHQRLKLRFSLLQAAAIAVAFLSLLKSLVSRVLSVFSTSMDDLFAADDFFSSSSYGVDDGDLLFSRRDRRPVGEFSGAEDRFYLVPFWWWEDAAKECYGNSEDIRGDLYESAASLEDDWSSTMLGGSDLDWEVTFSLARKEMDDSVGREDPSSRKYALLPETMWFKTLMWHSDYRKANKDIGCSLAAEGDSWDLFPLQIRLSVMWQTGLVIVKICEMDNMFQNYRRAYELFRPQSSMIQIWDFSGQITKLLKVDSTVLHHDVSQSNVELKGLPQQFLFPTAIVFLAVLPFSAAETPLLNSQGLDEDSGARDLKQEQDHTHEVHCSRERSRAAWNIIEEYLMPFAEREKYDIPRSCRLHADNDLFRDQEEKKINVDVNEWRCGYCKKSFVSEKFLDQHLDSRHRSLLNISQGKCLADSCGALHCDHVMKSKSPRMKCNPAAALRNRHTCEKLAHSCFPVSGGPSASRLHELFMHQFCDAHTCSGEIKPFSRGGRKQPSVLYLAMSILTLMLLPLFYVIVCLHHSEIRNDTQKLRRITKFQRKAKPS